MNLFRGKLYVQALAVTALLGVFVACGAQETESTDHEKTSDESSDSTGITREKDSTMWSEVVPLPGGGGVTCVGIGYYAHGSAGGISCDWEAAR